MKTLELWVLSYLLNSLWQVPLLFAVGWLVGRALRPVSDVAEHRVWVLTLFSQSLLPGISLFSWRWLSAVSLWQAGMAEKAHVSVVMGAGTGLAAMRVPEAVLGAITLLYGVVCFYFVARFVWRGVSLVLLRREAVEVCLSGRAAEQWAMCSARFAMVDVSIAASSRILGPVTLGLRRKLILVPAGMLENLADLDFCTVIAHEFAHLRRRDFSKNLLYELSCLPVSYHPLLWLTRENIMQSREMVCDRMAAELMGRTEYAQSLLRLALLVVKAAPVRTPHAIGIFDANAFERRVMRLADKATEMHGLRRMVLVAACAFVWLGTCGSVLALAVHVEGGSAEHPVPHSLNVSPAVMEKNLLNKVVPVYPPDAKKAKVHGTVVLEAVIGKDGSIKNLKVISGPAVLQQSALDAVRQWSYTPYRLNGDPIEVVTSIRVIYALAG